MREPLLPEDGTRSPAPMSMRVLYRAVPVPVPVPVGGSSQLVRVGTYLLFCPKVDEDEMPEANKLVGVFWEFG